MSAQVLRFPTSHSPPSKMPEYVVDPGNSYSQRMIESKRDTLMNWCVANSLDWTFEEFCYWVKTGEKPK